MPTELLKTKLHLPPVRAKQVYRPRLLKRLDTGLEGKLILVSAPAGFGKTTLVSAWVKGNRIPTAWFSVDKDDNDPARFWSYFISALHSIEASIGETTLAVLRSTLEPTIEMLLPGLLNEIEDLQSRFVLVLDDFHVIENQSILDGVLYLLEHLPPAMHLLLSTRADPPWPLARLRGQGEITEVRVEDLRFTLEEATEFLNSVMGMALLPEDMSALEARTEGWAAGLQLAGLSLQDKEDKTGFIRMFTGSNRFILDYLLEEVLDRQSQENLDFLLKTSMLDRMTAALCDAIVEKQDSQSILAQLEKDNLFLIPLDDERRWYRYHHIFADLLRIRLQQLVPAQVPGLHRRASQWFESQNLLAEAVKYALLANDLDRAAELIEAHAFAMIHQGQLSTLSGWITSLPADVIQSRPWLSVALAWVYAYSGNLGRVESTCLAAETAFPNAAGSGGDQNSPAQRNHIAGHVAAIRGYCALVLTGNLPLAEDLARKALYLLLADDLETREFAAIIHSISLVARGDLLVGEQVLVNPGFMESSSNIFLKVFILGELAILCIVKGQLHRAAAACQNAIQLAERHTKQNAQIIPSVGFAYSHLSAVLCEWNQLKEAVQHARVAVKIGEGWGQKDSLMMAYPRLAFALSAVGKTEEAYLTIQMGRQIVSALSGRMKNYVIAMQARLHLANGDIDMAGACISEIGLHPEDGIHYEDAYAYRPYARFLIAQEQYDRALLILDRLLPLEEAAGAIGGVIEDLLLKALAMAGSGDKPAALIAFSRALDLAEPEGYLRTFVNAGEAGLTLLQSLPARRRESGYVKKLLDAIQDEASNRKARHEPAASVSIDQPGRLVDQLTRREIEVLRSLASRASIEDIANDLCISTSTLRTHIRNIYDKLGVHSRLEAIAAARELKITQ